MATAPVGEPLQPEVQYRTVTAVEVRQAMQLRHQQTGYHKLYVDHHTCGACGDMTFYESSSIGPTLKYNSSCGCVKSTPTPRTWQEAAEWINMQSRGVHKADIMRRFHLTPTDFEITGA